MVQARKRVSYILPPPSESTPLLQLPPVGVSRLGAVGPLLITSPTKRGQKGVSGRPHHPRHRLGIASLALDTSTQLVGHYAPEGILYSGGRDGLIMSWDLGIQLKKRKPKDSADGLRRRARWEAMTGWGDGAIDEETDDDERLTSDGDILGEVTNTIGKRKREATLAADFPYERRWEMDLSAFEAGAPTRFRQSVQAHGDWVNDILLCNHNQTVISASSDGTLKSWNPHATVLEDPSTIGSHSDYVRCLAHCREQNWIASGAFDRTVKLWDMSSHTKSPLVTLNPPDTTAPKSSIYALAVDPFGQVIASGSPERVIRLWDPRSGKRIGKLVGHTDNIRAMIISADSKYLLTGSADASIKLWSLASQRCLHTFAHHTESVWSLFSDHPSLEVFYSGDRSGLVCRVDVEDCSDISEGECVLLCNDVDSGKTTSEGINKLVVMDDNLLWTASGTSTLRRWKIPPRRVSRPGIYLLDDGDRLPPFTHAHPTKGRTFPISDGTEANVRFTEPIHSGSLSGAPSLYSFTSERLRDREVDSKWNYLPYDSLVRLISANDPFPHFSTRARDPEVATLYSAASVLSIPRINLGISPTALVHSPPPSHVHGSRTDDTIFPSDTARAKYEEREFAVDATPICPEPDFVISGDTGFVRCIMLNDRIHALAVDTLGGVVVWDVIRGMCLGRYSPEDIASASVSGSTTGGSGEGERSPRESLDLVRDRIEGEAAVSPWCTIDTKAGVLTIHLMEKWFEAEVYADEVGFATHRHFNEDSKLNLGKWILRNLFLEFISEEVRHRSRRAEGYPPSLSRASSQEIFDPRTPVSPAFPDTSAYPSSSTTLICSPTMKRAIVPAAPAMVRSSPLIAPLIPLHPQANMTVMPPIPQSPTPGHHRTRSTGTTDGSFPPDAKDDYFSGRLRQNAGLASPEDSRTEPPTPITPSGLMGRLRNFGRTKRPVSDTPSVVPTTATETPTSEETKDVVEVPKTPIQVLLSGPLNPATSSDAPTMSKPPNATILISEEGSPSYTVVYRSLASGCHDNIEALENAMPLWLAEYLLLNQSPVMPPPIKVSFVLVPWNKDQDAEPLPELLNTQQSKLTANRNLRIRKILCHVQDRIERMSTSSRAVSIRSSFDGLPGRNPHTHNPSRPQAEEMYELLCNDTILPLGMTLAAVRQYVWKSSAELVLVYRRKKKPS